MPEVGRERGRCHRHLAEGREGRRPGGGGQSVDSAAAGAAVKGAAKCAAVGAIIGSISGNAGDGAAYGAVGGAAAGRRAKKSAKAQAQTQAEQKAAAENKALSWTRWKKGMAVCLEAKGTRSSRAPTNIR